MSVCLLASSILAIFFPALTSTQRTYAVNTSYGVVIGRFLHVPDSSASVFLGIPYAEPPMGSLRFEVSGLTQCLILHIYDIDQAL